MFKRLAKQLGKLGIRNFRCHITKTYEYNIVKDILVTRAVKLG
jgi:hypothetical protein